MDPTFGKKILHSYQYNSDDSEKYGEDLSGDLLNDVDVSSNSFRNPTFTNYNALKLANLDAIFKFTGHMMGIVNPVIDDDFDDMYYYLDLCCGKGGFTEYMIYRRPFSRGSGITLNNENIYDGLGNFTLCKERNGDILSDPNQIADFFVKRYPPVMVSFCDGVINEKPLDLQYKDYIGYPNSESSIELPEIDSDYTQTDLLKIQAYIAMCASDNNSMVICRLSNPLNWEEGQVLQDLSAFFDTMTLLRPITAEKGEVYLIAQGFNHDIFNFKIPHVPMKKKFFEWFLEGARLVKSPTPLPKNYIDLSLIRWGLSSGSMKREKIKELKSVALNIFDKWSNEKGDDWEYLFTKYFKYLEQNKEWDHSDEESEPIIFTKDHLYDITTKRGTSVTLVTSKVNPYLELISRDWNYLEDVIDWYSPFGFVGFRKLENNLLIDANANPFTRCNGKWYSLFREKGSMGSIFDGSVIHSECQLFVYPSVSFMNKIYDLFEEGKIRKMIVYCPRWLGHLLFNHLKNVELKHPDLIDYTTGEKFKLDTPYVRGVLEK